MTKDHQTPNNYYRLKSKELITTTKSRQQQHKKIKLKNDDEEFKREEINITSIDSNFDNNHSIYYNYYYYSNSAEDTCELNEGITDATTNTTFSISLMMTPYNSYQRIFMQECPLEYFPSSPDQPDKQSQLTCISILFQI